MDTVDRAPPAVLLLAAGYGRRFGADKTLAPWRDGTPLALVTLRNILQGGGRVMVVLRPEQRELARLLQPYPVGWVRSAQCRQGIGASLAVGVEATASAGGWLVALADMPDIRPQTYRTALRYLAQAPEGALCAPHYLGVRGNPVGFGRAWFGALRAQSGDCGARDLLQRQLARVRLLDCDDRGVLRDVDQPDDLPQDTAA